MNWSANPTTKVSDPMAERKRDTNAKGRGRQRERRKARQASEMNQAPGGAE